VSPSQTIDRLLAPHPGPHGTGKGFGISAVKAALFASARMSALGQEPVPAAGAGRELGTPALGRLGQCSGPRAA